MALPILYGRLKAVRFCFSGGLLKQNCHLLEIKTNMPNKDIAAYRQCADENGKMNFLSDYEGNPNDAFVDFLLAELPDEEDEFLQVEIIRFLADARPKSDTVKTALMDYMLTAEGCDEMVLAHLAQNLVLFALNADDLQTVYEKTVAVSQAQDVQEDFACSLLRLLYIHRENGAADYLAKLKEQGITFEG